jgi:uncharacterized protein YcbK (DUF882 family)
MKRLFIFLAIFIGIGVAMFLSYFNNTTLVNPIIVSYYTQLKETLKQEGYKDRMVVVCTKRSTWVNYILNKISQAELKSRHLKGEAIDILVGDVNSDGRTNGQDVDIVFYLLDIKIIKDQGGIGTYKNKSPLIKQMVHFDCRGYKARWHR